MAVIQAKAAERNSLPAAESDHPAWKPGHRASLVPGRQLQNHLGVITCQVPGLCPDLPALGVGYEFPPVPLLPDRIAHFDDLVIFVEDRYIHFRHHDIVARDGMRPIGSDSGSFHAGTCFHFDGRIAIQNGIRSMVERCNLLRNFCALLQ